MKYNSPLFTESKFAGLLIMSVSRCFDSCSAEWLADDPQSIFRGFNRLFLEDSTDR